ncbi:MAG: DPP IV N-terminal domain-containing protein [Alloprevotella sp.]
MKKRIVWSLLLLLLMTPVTAQTKKSFTLDDLMWGGSNYWNLQPKSYSAAFWGDKLVKLSVDDAAQAFTEKGKDAGMKRLFTIEDVNAALDTARVGKVYNILYASFPYADRTEVLLATSKLRFLYDWAARKIVWQQTVTAGTQHSEFCTASKSEAYVKDWNLFVRTADGKEHQVSKDGTRQLQYGLSVHRNEFGIEKGTFFSPSGKLLAFYRMDQSMVTDFPLIDASTRVAQLAPEAYPMAGMTSHKVQVGVYNPETETTVYLQTGDPTDRYFTNIAWSPDEKTVYVIELPRTQDKAELVAYDAATGKRGAVLYTETNPKYVEPMNPIVFLPWDADKFIYQSRRDGFNHLYLMSVSGGEPKQLTKGEFEVLQFLGFHATSKSVIVKTNEASPIRHNLYAVSLKTLKRTLLDNGRGTHRATLSAGGAWILDRWSAPDTFRQTELVSTCGAKPVVLQTDGTPWKDYNVPEVSGGTIKAADGKTDLYYRLVKPVGFAPAKKYPAVVYVYGGPHAHNVDESWNYLMRPWEAYMAQKGYVIFVVDNRGSENRGFEFESATFRHLGEVEMEDQMKGVEFLTSLPYVDKDRLGVHGWSFGGFMTTNLMCTHPDVFKVGVAGGPVIDWKYYEVMYGERYMDTPQENPEGYERCSLLNKAKNLKGRLQIIVGLNDGTCVLQHSLAFLRACEDAGTQPDYFVYPGQEHNMMGRDMVHLHERITRYFEDFLK